VSNLTPTECSARLFIEDPLAAKRIKPTEPTEVEGVGHPLFPAEGDEDEVLGIGSITIGRWNPRLGVLEYAPGRFMAEEFMDTTAISERFGGGKYTLVGRTAAGNRILKKVSYQIAGASKPLVGTEEDSGPYTPPGQQQPTQVVHAPPPAPAPSFNWAQLLPLLVPIFLEYLKTSAADRASMLARSDQTMQLMMQQQQSSSQAFITAMSQLYSKGGGGNGSADFQAGIQFMENLLESKMNAAEEAGKGDDAGELLKVMGQAFEAAKLMSTGSGGAAPAAVGPVAS